MTLISLDLSVYVPSGGHRWVVETGKPADDPSAFRLTANAIPADSGLLLMCFKPFMANAALFRDFAEVVPDCVGVCKFANKYGRLNDAPPFLKLEDRDNPPVPEQEGWCDAETLKVWQEEIRAMRASVELWDMIVAKDVKGLAARVRTRRDPGGQTSVIFDGGVEGKPPRPLGSEALAEMKHNDPARLAYFFVQWTINRRLEELVRPTMLWNSDRRCLEIQLFPSSLLGGLWLQFADAVEGQKKQRRCEACGKWMNALRPGPRESDATCSDPCRSKCYRARKSAREKKAEGWSYEAIAKTVGFDVAKIKMWTSQKAQDKSGSKKRKRRR